MLTLFYSPGACSLASHIALEETGAAYREHPVVLANEQQRTPEYLRVNPRGRVPALLVGEEVLTENLAIMTYIAHRHPDAKLMPLGDPLALAKCLSTMAWLASTVHPSATHIFRPGRFAEDAAAQPSVKETGLKSFHGYLREIDGLLEGKEWMLGAFSVCDPYLLVFYLWGLRLKLPMGDLANYTALKQRLLARPAVRRVVEREELTALLHQPG